MDYSVVESVAAKEVLEQRLDLTRQYLANHRVCLEHGKPLVAHVQFKHDQVFSRAVVYFSLEDQRFFLAVVVEQTTNAEVSWVYIEAGSLVYLSISNSGADVEDLPFTPTKITKHGFEYAVNANEPGDVSEKVEILVQSLIPFSRQITELSKRTTICLHVAYYGYAHSMSGLHLSAKVIGLLSEMNIAVDLDLYADGNALPD